MIGVYTGVYGPHAGLPMRDCTATSCAGGLKRMECSELKLQTSSAKEERACNGSSPLADNAKSGRAWTGCRSIQRRMGAKGNH
jgi:hypothetical protein